MATAVADLVDLAPSFLKQLYIERRLLSMPPGRKAISGSELFDLDFVTVSRKREFFGDEEC
jgi:hypothetical protein